MAFALVANACRYVCPGGFDIRFDAKISAPALRKKRLPSAKFLCDFIRFAVLLFEVRVFVSVLWIVRQREYRVPYFRVALVAFSVNEAHADKSIFFTASGRLSQTASVRMICNH